MKFKPFPPGTVRGPYRCGHGNNPKGGVQFLVQTRGGWVPFIRAFYEEGECCKAANDYAAKVLKTKGTP